MAIGIDTFESVSDEELLRQIKSLAAGERETTARLIAAIAAIDARRLYLGEGCSSMFTYCTQVLRLSEHAAYGRIEAARSARRFPLVLDLLAEGSITLTTTGLLSAHLTTENHRELLFVACGKSKREVEQLVAAIRPLPAVTATIRKLPEPNRVLPLEAADYSASTSASTPRAPLSLAVPGAKTPARVREEVRPLAPSRYKVQFTASSETYQKLRQAQDLLRHVHPTGDIAAVIDRALTLLIADLQRCRTGAAKRPRACRAASVRSRRIPAAVRRAVWDRDEGQCAFVGREGRCAERGFLEFHHVVPYAAGGPSTVENVQVRCRAHNAHEAREYFGDVFTRSGPS